MTDPYDWEKLLETIAKWKGKDKVMDFIQPNVMLKEMEESLRNGSDPGTTTQFALSRSVNTSHPLFVNQLYGGVHPTGVASAFIMEQLNTNAHTYEVAPVFVLAERLVLKELRKLFFGSETGDGIFAPGGSFSNMYAFVLARHKKFPDVKKSGVFGLPPMKIFTSQDAHYSVSKAAIWMGLGLDNVVKVETDKRGRMIPEALSRAIVQCRKDGNCPLAVNATAGTTVLGAFDDFTAISKICRDEGVWLHCDAAWGGSFIFSPRLRSQTLKGIEQCDSVAWNAHKMLGAPLQCSAFITKEGEDSLSSCNSLNASYLFHPDKCYPAEFDRSGDKSFQCGRKGDAFKLWYMWVTLGLGEFQRMIESVESCAKYFTDQIKGREDFLLYLDRHQCTNVFFWYVPPRLQGKDKDATWWSEVSNVSVKIKERMMLEGHVMVGYSPLPHKNVPNALRLVLTACPPKTHQLMDTIIDFIVKYGQDL